MLLWLNLVTDSLPALALGVEPIEKDVMKKQPRDKDESIFAHGLGINAVWQGIMFGAITLVAYFLGLKESGGQVIYAQSMAFAVLSISQLIHAFNCRSEHSIFVAGVFRNMKMWGAFGISLALVLLIQLVPALRRVFGLAALNATEFLEIGLLSIVPLVVCEIVKAITALIKKLFPQLFNKRKPRNIKRVRHISNVQLPSEPNTPDTDGDDDTADSDQFADTDSDNDNADSEQFADTDSDDDTADSEQSADTDSDNDNADSEQSADTDSDNDTAEGEQSTDTDSDDDAAEGTDSVAADKSVNDGSNEIPDEPTEE